MRKIIIALTPVIALLSSLMSPAQGTLYVSNLLQTPIGSGPIGSDSWLAGYFETGTNAGGYVLNSVQLLMDAASGTPGGFTVSLYSSTNFSGPGTNLGQLGGPDPLAGGLFTYTNSGIAVAPAAYYSVVVNAATPMAQGAYEWSGAFASDRSGDGWIIGPGYYSSADGSSWQFSRAYTLQMAIYATAIPEPATLVLAGMGLAALSFWRRKF